MRMYLREMGSVELLSREGEIAIAKRIKAGRETMIAGLRNSPISSPVSPASTWISWRWCLILSLSLATRFFQPFALNLDTLRKLKHPRRSRILRSFLDN
jgi:hypothetical protein